MPSVVIVGAGVIGASIAYHLAARGVRDVVVLDRGDEPGAGSTPRATGGFRAQFATPADIALSLLSREKLIRFNDEIGVDSGYRPYGYLFIARSEQAMAQLRDRERAAARVRIARGARDRCRGSARGSIRRSSMTRSSAARSVRPTVSSAR